MRPPRWAAWAAILMLTSCAGWRRPAPPVLRLGLDAEASSPAPGLSGLVVEVDPFATSPVFRTDRLAVRDGRAGYRFLSAARWAAEPGPLVSDALRRALARGGHARAVYPAPSPAPVQLRITGTVDACYWDRARGAFVLGATWTVLSPTGEPLAFRSDSWEESVDPPTLPGLSAAADRAAGRLADAVLQTLGEKPGFISPREPRLR